MKKRFVSASLFLLVTAVPVSAQVPKTILAEMATAVG